ncbi:hypothetical protein L1987_22588 [Smallanthus sonchifolius]|uniref:Uncharacterized protein n=1 Tax=Smallanthus sonchifolius TaxID=185202 RepID=A0ACB9IH08_9ASTR|nr:hypothetical protein L1987_22588 [Smallanthus sonchifolius]
MKPFSSSIITKTLSLSLLTELAYYSPLTPTSSDSPKILTATETASSVYTSNSKTTVSDRRNPRSGSCSFLVLVLRSRISRFLNDSNKTSNIQQQFGLCALTGHGVVL